MTDSAIGTNSRTREIMKKYGLRAKKGFGQNFLTDPGILDGIVDAAKINRQDNVIEIGPGIGALTEKLAQRAGQVLALEIDSDLIPVLDEVLQDYDNVKVLEQDVLKADLRDLIQANFTDQDRPVKVVANLPYYITSPILMKLLNSDISWAGICVMMQKEVAQRLAAHPGTKEYGSLTLAINLTMDAKLAFGVSRHSFVPAPNVDSAIVVLSPRQEELPVQPFDRDQLMKLVKICFAHRRKNLWNNLKAVMGKDSQTQEAVQTLLDQLGINPQDRPANLDLNQYIALANGLHGQKII